MLVTEKVCPQCQELLPAARFSRNQSKSDCLQSLCKICRAENRKKIADAKPKDRQRKLMSTAVENTNPAKFAEAYDMLTDPLCKSHAQIARETGLSVALVREVAQRADTRYANLTADLRDVKGEKLIKLYENAAVNVLESVSVENIRNANLKDKFISAGIATSRALEIRNKGAIPIVYTDATRATVAEVTRGILVELKRRGMTYDICPETGEVEVTEGDFVEPEEGDDDND